jgi:signal transduction histidine kinase
MLEQYDNLQKQKEIETLKAKNEKIALEKQLQARQLYFSLALIALLLTLLGLLWIYRQQQQQALQHQQKIKEMLHEQERKVLAATVKTQLQERERLGKEVHDNLGSLLATLKLQHIGGKQFWDKPDLFRESYMAMGPLIQQTADEAHRIAHEMDAGEQFAFELKPALEGLMQHIRATRQFELVFEYLGKTFKLPRKLALTIYQVTLEASANILKHAQAKNVTVRVFQRSSSVILTVEDDGRGFDTKTYQAGIGLRSMQERVSALGGNINIESTPKSGTTITATMPISSGIDI